MAIARGVYDRKIILDAMKHRMVLAFVIANGKTTRK